MTASNLKVGFSVAHASRVSGGVSEVLRCLGGSIASRGCEVRIFAAADAYLSAGTSRWEDIDTEILKTRPPRQFGYQVGLRQAVADWSPDVMHVHGLWMYPSWATRHWRRMKLPYVVAPHGMMDRWALANANFKKRTAYTCFEKASLEGAACLHALNEMELAAIREAGLRGPVAVITNGTDLPDRVAKGSGKNKTLLYFGRLHPKKGLAELLEAFALTRRAAPNWRLIVAGWDDGGYLDTLRSICAGLDISDVVSFPGPAFDKNKEDRFLQADAFILPSKSEGMPMAVLEAWSYGLPVLMTPECNLQNGFSEGAALRITCTPDAMAAQLTAFFDLSEEERRKIGIAGRYLVRSSYRWSSIAEQTTTLYSWIMGESGRPEFIDPGK